MFEEKKRLPKPHLWLIAFIGVIVPRRLAAGMGGRVTLSRRVAGRMGQTQLANST